MSNRKLTSAISWFVRRIAAIVNVIAIPIQWDAFLVTALELGHFALGIGGGGWLCRLRHPPQHHERQNAP